MLFKFQAVTIKPHLLMVMHFLKFDIGGCWSLTSLWAIPCSVFEPWGSQQDRGQRLSLVAVCQGDGVRWVIGLSMSIMSRDLGSELQWHVQAVWLCESFRAHLWPCCGREYQSPGWVGFGYLLEGEWFGKSQEWRLLSSQILSRSETSPLISRSPMQLHRGLSIE